MFSKKEKPRFSVNLTIHELTNVPLVSGYVYVKWYLPASRKADARGKTPRAAIKDHKAVWEYETSTSTRFSIDKSGTLEEEKAEFEIFQEHRGIDRLRLGRLGLNLAEYVNRKETRRYLLQDSKVNSTIRITIHMAQQGGDTNYTAPSLRNANVFGGITGVFGENKDKYLGNHDEDLTLLNTLGSDGPGYAQQVYRTTLAASVQLATGELPPMQVVDGIFAGGNGWTGSVSPVQAESGLEEGNEIMAELEREDLRSWQVEYNNKRHK